MSSCILKNQDSDEEVDLEALRLAALKSRKPKYTRVNHNNLTPIVPLAVDSPDLLISKNIKSEKISPTPEDGITADITNKPNEEDKMSNYSESTIENDQDILSMDDKEEEDSLERIMDQLEAEISGKVPASTDMIATSKNSSKDKTKKYKKIKKDGNDEVELVHIKSTKEPKAIIEVRESASPETISKGINDRKLDFFEKSPKRRSRSKLRSKSPFSRARSYKRSRSPYWSRSPRRSRSPGRNRSFSRFSRSRSRSFERRRSPWSISPRRRSKSPFYREDLSLGRRRNFTSRSRRSFSPRNSSVSPRRRSRSPRRFFRNSPFRRSKSPFFRRSRTPMKRNNSPNRHSKSPYLDRSKSPFSKLNSPTTNKFPLERRSKSPVRRSLPDSPKKANSKPRSKSPFCREDLPPSRRRNFNSPTGRRRSFSPRNSRVSPRRRSRSPRRFFRNSPFRRSKSPFFRRSRTPIKRNNSPNRHSKSPYLDRSKSPFSKLNSPTTIKFPLEIRSNSPTRGSLPDFSEKANFKSKSPFYREDLSLGRRHNFNTSAGRRRSYSPRNSSISPRRRSRSPRRLFRNSPFRRSKSPFFRRSRTPIKRNDSFNRHSKSPYLNRSHSPFLERRSRSPFRQSLPVSSEKANSKPRSKSPERSGPKGVRSLSFSTSPTPRRNRSPLRVVEKNKIDEKSNSFRDKSRNEKRHRSLSRENRGDRRHYRQRNFRKYSPIRSRKTPEKHKSPKPREAPDKVKEILKPNVKEKIIGPVLAPPPDSVLEARKKKFGSMNEIDPSIDKKISLKSIKESSENVEEDEDALTINVEGNLWDESEESDNEFESRFKSGDTKKRGTGNRTVLSFRNLREGDAANKKINLNKPLTEDNRRDGSRRDRHDRWHIERNDKRKKSNLYESKNRNENYDSKEKQKSDKLGPLSHRSEKSNRKPIVWSEKSEKKVGNNFKENESSNAKFEEKSKNCNKTFLENKDKSGKSVSDIPESDDFDKLISDFEKELESDVCLSTKGDNSMENSTLINVKRPKISVKKDLFERKIVAEPLIKKPARTVKISDASPEKSLELENNCKAVEDSEKTEATKSQSTLDGPEDYVEDDDFVLEVSEVSGIRKQKGKVDEEDSKSDLRAVLSRRRNERLTKAVSLQENMPTRLVQSAFQGLGNQKSRRPVREAQDNVELPLVERNVKNTGIERRRVLLLQREKNPLLPTVKCTVSEVKPDSTIYQRLKKPNERRKRKLHRQLDLVEDLDQEEEEEEGFEVEEEKQSRRFRLKRNVTLSSQVVKLPTRQSQHQSFLKVQN